MALKAERRILAIDRHFNSLWLILFLFSIFVVKAGNKKKEN